MKKASYKAILGANLIRKGLQPGDILTLTLRNDDSDEGAFKMAQRISDMFLKCYGFWPQSIGVHPDHLAILKKQGKRLDIIIGEEAVKIIGQIIDLADLPRSIPLVGDVSLDLFTVTARYDLKAQDMEEISIEGVKWLLSEWGKI